VGIYSRTAAEKITRQLSKVNASCRKVSAIQLKLRVRRREVRVAMSPDDLKHSGIDGMGKTWG
jgi:hypothetical protein